MSERKLRSVSWLWIKVILLLRYLGASLKTHVFFTWSHDQQGCDPSTNATISRTLACAAGFFSGIQERREPGKGTGPIL